MKTALLLSASLGLCLVARAESPDSIPDPRKTNHSSIYDGAGVLNTDEKYRIDNAINALEEKTRAQALVVTVQTLDGMGIENFSNTLGRRFGVGGRGRDQGVLFVFAIQDRKSWIEVGLGLEDRLTDARAAAITREQIRPAFRNGAYGQGILDAVKVATNYIEGGTRPISPSNGAGDNSLPPNGSSPAIYAPPSSSSGGSGAGFLLFLTALVVGGTGTIIYMSTRPRRCPRCNTTMKSAEAPENELSGAQQCERHLGTRSFIKVSCPKCNFYQIEGKDSTFSGVTTCQKCHNRTAQIRKHLLKEPTYSSQGAELVTEECEYPPCRHKHSYERLVPRLVHSSAATTGVFIGGVGGGFGGGSDSGSSSSGSSYDGGASSSYGGGDFGGGGGGSDW